MRDSTRRDGAMALPMARTRWFDVREASHEEPEVPFRDVHDASVLVSNAGAFLRCESVIARIRLQIDARDRRLAGAQPAGPLGPREPDAASQRPLRLIDDHRACQSLRRRRHRSETQR